MLKPGLKSSVISPFKTSNFKKSSLVEDIKRWFSPNYFLITEKKKLGHIPLLPLLSSKCFWLLKRWTRKDDKKDDLKGVKKKTSTFFKRILLCFYACYNNGWHLILTTTKFAILNGINQPCRINTFWFIDYCVTKFEKLPCMILP